MHTEGNVKDLMTPVADNAKLFASLRPFLRQNQAAESRCELCGAGIGEHSHLLELKTRQVVCSCQACAILFGGHAAATYRLIPRDVRELADFQLTAVEWEALAIPINMAFFCMRGDPLAPAVFYPSPAGAIQSLLPLESWRQIAANNPLVRGMQPEVECLLINRITNPHEYYLAPIDDCYRLVGMIRSKWRGFAGGKEAWTEIAAFFSALKKRSIPAREKAHARSEFSD